MILTRGHGIEYNVALIGAGLALMFLGGADGASTSRLRNKPIVWSRCETGPGESRAKLSLVSRSRNLANGRNAWSYQALARRFE